MSEPLAEIAASHTMVIRRAIEMAVTESTLNAIDLLCNYVEEAGVDDPGLRALIDEWRASVPTRP